jgi:hypothetical protein
MSEPSAPSVCACPGVFAVDDVDGLESFYHQHGFAVLAGAVDERQLLLLERECAGAQEALVAGQLDGRYGTTELIETGAESKARQFANYVLRITELSPVAADIAAAPIIADVILRCLGPGCWSGTDVRFGYVYQDARPSEQSSYKRIGWHSDWQSGPHLRVWPSTAVTVHVDGTSPANGFLRVVPGSHRWATPAPFDNVNGAVVPEGSAPYGGYTDQPPPLPMPLHFEKVPGEMALYADRGDILFHDCYLWHSAAVATDPDARRRHVRGSWFSGAAPAAAEWRDFVKNAAR